MWWVAEEIRDRVWFGLQTATLPEPEAAQAVLKKRTPEVPDDYLKLAQNVGYQPKALKPRRLLAALGELGLVVFDRKKVELYLNKQYGMKYKDNAKWGWRLLDNPNGYWSRTSVTENGQMLAGPYTKPIPYPVLQTMNDIKSKVTDVRFFISDEVTESDRPKDPFLIAEREGEPAYIIERWDEPSFRG